MGDIAKNITSPVPTDALSVSSISQTINDSLTLGPMDRTLRGGNMLGIIRPYWTKVTESEQRIALLESMIRRGLVVRDLEAYGKAISAKLRSDELRCKEEERSLLIGVMRLKLKDEKLNLRELTRLREGMRQQIIGEIGRSRKYDNIMKTSYG